MSAMLRCTSASIALVLFCTTACGGSARDSSTPPGEQSGDLPPLTALGLPSRLSSVIGPGFLTLDPQSYSFSAGAVNELDGSVTLSATVGPAYAIFSVGGFPGSDVQPTSVRISVASGSDPYYVAFSDYVAGQWAFTGPFTDSAEVEQVLPPGAVGYGGPDDFVSGSGATHFAVISNPGESVVLTGAALGVMESGDLPLPLTFARYTGQASPLVLTWSPSPSHKELDFAGYLIERAPRYFGSFESLTPAPVTDLYFLDDSADPSQQYRIRIAAVDTSGDRSAWFTAYGPGGEPADPICILGLPDGPLYGPLEVTFDMSASFDPLGESISDYQITFDSSGPAAMGPEPVKVLELQPGSYSIGASIVTQDSFRYGSTQRQLTVLPQWEAAPVVIRASSEGNDNQYVDVDCYRDQQTARLVFTAYDRNIPGLTFIRDLGGGSYERLVAPPLTASSYYEPYIAGQEYLVPLCNALFTHAIATAEGGDARYLSVTGTYAQPGKVITSFADADGRLWLLQFAGSSLRATLFDNPGMSLELITGLLSCEWACPLLDESTGLVHIAASVYNFVPEYHLRYVQFDPATLASSEEEIGPIQLTYPDIELNPGTGQPGVAAYDNSGYVFFTQRNGANDWTTPVQVDNLNANGPFDLEYGQSGPLVYLSSVTVKLYEFDGADFSERNDPSFTADLCDSLAMEPVPGTDDMEVITVVSTGETYHATLLADGSDIVHKEFLPEEACAQHISAAASGGYLHFICRSGIDNHCEHFRYDPFSHSTEALAAFGASKWVELSATSGGELLASHADEFYANLEYWDSSAWNGLATESIDSLHAPLLQSLPEPSMRWIGCNSDPSPELKYFYGSSSGGAVQPYSYPFTAQFGSLSGSAGFARALIAEAAPFSTDVEGISLWRVSDQSRMPIYDPPGNAPQEYFASVAAFGCPTAFAYGGDQHFWCAVGPNGTPARLTVQANGLTDIEPLPGDWDTALVDGGDPYRTVSAALASGDTPVCLIASLLGEEIRLEWLNNGSWEALPLPSGLASGGSERVSKPELATVNGCLVILWHDYMTQQIKAWQTELPAVT